MRDCEIMSGWTRMFDIVLHGRIIMLQEVLHPVLLVLCLSGSLIYALAF